MSIGVFFMLCTITILALYRDQVVVRQRGFLFLTFFCVGSMLLFISIALGSQHPSNLLCLMHIHFAVFGWIIMSLSLLAREILVYMVFRNTMKRKKSVDLYKIPVIFSSLMMSMETILLTLWSYFEPHIPARRIVDSTTVIHYCTKSSKKSFIFSTLLIAFNAVPLILLVMFAILNRQVPNEYNTSSQLILFSAASTFSVLLLFTVTAFNDLPTNENIFIIFAPYYFSYAFISYLWILTPILFNIKYLEKKHEIKSKKKSKRKVMGKLKENVGGEMTKFQTVDFIELVT
jgi:hypothetical protein